MIDWPIGLSTGCFSRTSIFECAEPILQHGFSMIEVCSSPEHLDYHDSAAVKDAAFMVKRLGLETYSFHAPYTKDIDLASPVKSERDYAREELLAAADAAAEFNARYLVVHPGPDKGLSTESTERFERLKSAAQTLNSVCEKCLEHGIVVVIENMLPNLFPGGVRELLWMLGAISYADIGTCFDTGHAFLAGEVAHYLHRMSGHLRMVHADDNHGTADDHLGVGEGAIDWMKIIAQISRFGFHGGIILELAAREAGDGEAVLTRAGESRHMLRTIFRTLDLADLQPMAGPSPA